MRGLHLMRLVAMPFGVVAAAILVFMMLYTTATVVLRQIFGIPAGGVVDIMELALVGLIFITMPGVFLRDENVTVDVIDHVIPHRVSAALRMLGLALALGFLLPVFIEMIPEAMQKYASGEVTMTVGIERYIHWIPILVGFGGSILATLWALGHYAIYGVPTNPPLDREQIG